MPPSPPETLYRVVANSSATFFGHYEQSGRKRPAALQVVDGVVQTSVADPDELTGLSLYSGPLTARGHFIGKLGWSVSQCPAALVFEHPSLLVQVDPNVPYRWLVSPREPTPQADFDAVLDSLRRQFTAELREEAVEGDFEQHSQMRFHLHLILRDALSRCSEVDEYVALDYVSRQLLSDRRLLPALYVVDALRGYAEREEEPDHAICAAVVARDFVSEGVAKVCRAHLRLLPGAEGATREHLAQTSGECDHYLAMHDIARARRYAREGRQFESLRALVLELAALEEDSEEEGKDGEATDEEERG